MEMRWVVTHDRVRGAVRGVDQAYQPAVRSVVLLEWIAITEQWPPLCCRPGFEGRSVIRREQVTRDPEGVHHHQLRTGLPHDVRADVEMPQQVRILIERAAITSGVPGEQTHPVHTRKVVQCGGPDLEHRDRLARSSRAVHDLVDAGRTRQVMRVLAVDGGQSGIRLRHSSSDDVIEVEGVSRLETDTQEAVAAAVAAGYRRGRWGPVDRAVLGLTTAPTDSPSRQRLCAAVAEATGAAEVWLADDSVTAHAGALSRSWGVSVVAGTGVACLAVPELGRTAHHRRTRLSAGGRGRLVLDRA